MAGALTKSRLDYANALYGELEKEKIARLQKIQNRAISLAKDLRPCDHVTQARRELHWLLVGKIIEFKILCIVHQAIYKGDPAFLKELLVAYVSFRTLRSSGGNLMYSPKYMYTKQGRRRWTVQSPSLWNKTATGLETYYQQNDV